MARTLTSGMETFPAAKQPFRSLVSCADANEAEDAMTHRRPRSPGSFQDELGGVIERIAQTDPKRHPNPGKPKERGVSNAAELNERLFEKAWRKHR